MKRYRPSKIGYSVGVSETGLGVIKILSHITAHPVGCFFFFFCGVYWVFFSNWQISFSYFCTYSQLTWDWAFQKKKKKLKPGGGQVFCAFSNIRKELFPCWLLVSCTYFALSCVQTCFSWINIVINVDYNKFREIFWKGVDADPYSSARYSRGRERNRCKRYITKVSMTAISPTSFVGAHTLSITWQTLKGILVDGVS